MRLHRREGHELWVRAQDPATPPRVRLRARIVLRASEGAPNHRIAVELGTDPGTVARWRRRFLLHGTPGILRDAPRPGRPPSISESKVELIVRSTFDARSLETPPRSSRRVARETGVGKSSVQRIWKARGIGPHRPVRAPASGTGMGFLDSVTDMVGLYLNPPERVIAFATDDRIRSVRLGRVEPREIADLRRRSEGVEFRAFLQVIDRETPGALDIHLLLDSRLAPTPPELSRWLSRHPRFHFHYLPSDRPGLTLVDRLVADFSQHRARPGESPSAQRLRHAIREHFRRSRGLPSPFVWTTTGQDIRDPIRSPSIRY